MPPSPHPHFTIHSARDLGPQFTRNPHRMVGFDGAYSIALEPNRALWYFGDTLFGARVPNESLWYPGGVQLGPGDMSGHGTIERLLTNTGVIVRDTTGAHGIQNFEFICGLDGHPRQLIPRLPSEHPDQIRTWCLHGIRIADELYLFFQNVRMLATGPMPVNFEILGSGLAVGSPDSFEFTRIERNNTTILWDSTLPQYAAAVLRGPDSMLYLYGVRRGDDGIQRCYLARVAESNLRYPESYEYLSSADENNPTWSPNPHAAIPIMTGMPNELSVSWNDYLGSYLAVHSLDLTGKIVARTAPNPWGPWSEPTTLWQAHRPDYDYPVPYFPLIYAGKEHPELGSDSGRTLYLTYIEFEEYYPHLIEVTLTKT